MSRQQQFATDASNSGDSDNSKPDQRARPAVTIQPTQLEQPIVKPYVKRVWVPAPSGPVPNCPPGLECLALVDHLIVHEVLNVVEVLTGFEMANKYEIRNSTGHNCFYAVEGVYCTRLILDLNFSNDLTN